MIIKEAKTATAELAMTNGFEISREFFAALERNPERAIQELGLEPTREILDAVSGVSFESLQKLADAFTGAPGKAKSWKFAFP